MGVDHGGPHIAVPHELLYGADIVVRLQQMAGETVPKGVGRGPLGDPGFLYCTPDRLLHMTLMEMISSQFLCLRDQGQRLGREKPLPNRLGGCVLVFCGQGAGQENAAVTGPDVFLMAIYHLFKMRLQFGHDRPGQRHGPVFLPLPVVNGQHPRIKIETAHPQVQTLG